jgi:hypothetical protein
LKNDRSKQHAGREDTVDASRRRSTSRVHELIMSDARYVGVMTETQV